jgi:hypothetical protein
MGSVVVTLRLHIVKTDSQKKRSGISRPAQLRTPVQIGEKLAGPHAMSAAPAAGIQLSFHPYP